MSVFEIVFSPTGGTQKVSGLVAGALDKNTVTVDLTDNGLDFSAVSMTEDDVAVISVPAYAGRIPAVVADRLGMVHGNGARAVLVCVYGNRAFEDTLVELEDVAKHAGFRVIAAVAAIAEHSIARQFAAGRPDAQDAAQLAEFAQQIQQKLLAEDASEPLSPAIVLINKLEVTACARGNRGLRLLRCMRRGVPRLCYRQGRPQASSWRGVHLLHALHCRMSASARKLDPNKLSAVSQMLSKACVVRKECELFI